MDTDVTHVTMRRVNKRNPDHVKMRIPRIQRNQLVIQ